MVFLKIYKFDNNDDLFQTKNIAPNKNHSFFENKDNWNNSVIEDFFENSSSNKSKCIMSLKNIEQSTPSKKKRCDFKEKTSNKYSKNSDPKPLLTTKLLKAPKNTKNASKILFSSFLSDNEQNTVTVLSECDGTALRSHSCSTLSLDTINKPLNVINIKTSPFDIDSVSLLSSSNIFDNLYSGSQLPSHPIRNNTKYKQNYSKFMNDSNNLFDEPNVNINFESYNLSLSEKTTKFLLPNTSNKLFFNKINKSSESKEQQQGCEHLNTKTADTYLDFQNLNYKNKDVKKLQKNKSNKQIRHRLNNLFILNTSTFVLNEHNFFEHNNKNLLHSKGFRVRANIELACNLNSNCGITESSGISGFNSHYSHTNLSLPSIFTTLNKILDPQSSALEIENAKTNSLNTILEHNFLSSSEEPIVKQEKTFKNKIKILKKARSQKWAFILSNRSNANPKNNIVEPETGISKNTTVKAFKKQELNVLKSEYAAGVETDILRKVQFKVYPTLCKQTKNLPPKYVPLYQKNSKISRKPLLIEPQSYYSPLKGSESTTSNQELTSLGRKWWIFGSLGERKYDKVDHGFDTIFANDADSMVISSSTKMDVDTTDDQILELSKPKTSLLKKLTRQFTKQGHLNRRKTLNQSYKKSLSVSFVKYTTNIYKHEKEGLNPVNLTSEFKARSILKK